MATPLTVFLWEMGVRGGDGGFKESYATEHSLTLEANQSQEMFDFTPSPFSIKEA